MCALAPSLDALIAARCLQALGGAAVVCSALERLSDETSDARAAAIWGAAGVAGVAVGPALGGLLTEAISWQSIFAFQVPIALAVLAVVLVKRQQQPATPPRARCNRGEAARTSAPTSRCCWSRRR